MTQRFKSFTEAVEPFTSKFTLASKLQMDVHMNPEGAKALGETLSALAELADELMADRRERKPRWYRFFQMIQGR